MIDRQAVYGKVPKMALKYCKEFCLVFALYMQPSHLAVLSLREKVGIELYNIFVILANFPNILQIIDNNTERMR